MAAASSAALSLPLAFSRSQPVPSFQIQNLRLVSRSGPGSKQVNHIAFSLVQRCGVIIKNGVFVDSYIPDDKKPPPKGGFELRGGCTMIFDLDSLKLRYAINRPLLDKDALASNQHQLDARRAEKQFNYQNNEGSLALSEYSKYFGGSLTSFVNEPFAFLHHL